MEWIGLALALVAAAFAVRAEQQRRALANRLLVAEDRRDRGLDVVEEANERQRQQRRLLDRLAWVIAVDARQPTINLKDELIALRRTRGEKLEVGERHLLDAAISNAEHAVRLLDEIGEWALAVEKPADITTVDVRDALDLALDELDHDGKATVDIESLPVVRADEALLAKALHEVLDNCVRYRFPNRPVHIKISAEDRGSQIRLLISDDGLGVDVRDEERLLQPFSRGEGSAAMPGTGLGLAVARRCLEAQQGTIGFEPQDERGTTVAITLPAG